MQSIEFDPVDDDNAALRAPDPSTVEQMAEM